MNFATLGASKALLEHYRNRGNSLLRDLDIIDKAERYGKHKIFCQQWKAILQYIEDKPEYVPYVNRVLEHVWKQRAISNILVGYMPDPRPSVHSVISSDQGGLRFVKRLEELLPQKVIDRILEDIFCE